MLSNEYLTKKATPRNKAKPPTHANSLTPMNCSQLTAGASAEAGLAAGLTADTEAVSRGGDGATAGTAGCATIASTRCRVVCATAGATAAMAGGGAAAMIGVPGGWARADFADSDCGA